VPVALVSSSFVPATTAGDATPAPETGFETALAARLGAPSVLPSVSLAHMVDALAGVAIPIGAAKLDAVGGASGTGSSVATAAVADAWGAAAAGRPDVELDAFGARVLEAGERYLGVPYKWGGTTASGGFDCSGFTQQVYADLGIRLPRVSVDQAKAGTAVAGMDQARPGDLVFWRGNGSRPNHIGIYAGEGTMLVAPRTGDVVKYQEIRRPPDGIRRLAG
jgi:peptidoglycan DL-endopeptidase CwlO